MLNVGRGRNGTCQGLDNMTISLFAYGTLQLPEVMAAVTGRAFDAVPAVLCDYARYRLRRRVYPGLRYAPAAVTTGTLFLEVDPLSLARLDRFEDAFYTRLEVLVSTSTGQRLAEVYVIPPRYKRLFVYRDWDLAAFGKERGAAYLCACRRQRR